MISRLRGQVAYKKEDYAVVEAGGVGYKVLMAPISLLNLREMEKVCIETSMQWSRGEPILYGFTDAPELELFERLLRVSGVGAKSSLKAVSGGVARVSNAINRGDIGELALVCGCSRKLATKIILDLRGKVVEQETTKEHPRVGFSTEDAVQTLIGYGFMETEVRGAVARIRKEGEELTLMEFVPKVLAELAPPQERR